MSSYDQGRMDAWERIDALKRRLGLLGFFNEQKHKRYPKGHPKAGEFMPKPKEGKKPVPARKVLNLNLAPVETEIDGNRFSLRFQNNGSRVGVEFLANDSYDMQDLPSSTKRKAAFWWRRNAVDTAKMMPDGVPLRAVAYSSDGKGQDRLDFYKALGFHNDSGMQVSAITRGGRIVPETKNEETGRRKVDIRNTESGKPRRAYTEQDYDRDLDNIFGSPRSEVSVFRGVDEAALPSMISLPLSRNTRPTILPDVSRPVDDDDIFDFANDDDDDDDWYNRAVERERNNRRNQ